jgi:hypothetical protein
MPGTTSSSAQETAPETRDGTRRRSRLSDIVEEPEHALPEQRSGAFIVVDCDEA